MSLILHEDEHLLVVNKPPGWNTHSPSPFASPGLFDWLRQRESRWGDLAIIHRLDKETSGVLLFGKTSLANRSLTQQFESRSVRKRYLLLTDHPPRPDSLTVRTGIVRVGDRYSTTPLRHGDDLAETRFKLLHQEGATCLVEAHPSTGRTHQIRVHAASEGFPVLGDTLYGGTRHHRTCLHAAELTLAHPATGEVVTFSAEPQFAVPAPLALRAALFAGQPTTAYRLLQGATEGWPGFVVDRLGDHLLVQGEEEPAPALREHLRQWAEQLGSQGLYLRLLDRQVRAQATRRNLSPKLLAGTPAAEPFVVVEEGVRYELSFNEGYSVGLFLDQRENRRRLRSRRLAADWQLEPPNGKPWEVLNAFAYTCAFSVCAALAGARVTSLDLSKKYLEWGRRQFVANQLDPAAHDFIYGDAFEWFARLAKKGRRFDLILLDPPTFSTSRSQGAFSAERDYGRLAQAALPLLLPGGVLFASTNAARVRPEAFLSDLHHAIRAVGRTPLREEYCPQPPDFPTGAGEPGYLKTVWLQVE
jgi:23S rRNA (cytosine1962-C5)-methyltransferase